MIDWDDYAPGEHRVTCYVCGRGPRDKSMGITVESDSGVAHCFRCGHVEVWRDRNIDKRPAKAMLNPSKPAKSKTGIDVARNILRASSPIAGTVAEAYLVNRGCARAPRDTHLRFAPELHHYPTGTKHPAMLAAITALDTGRTLGAHRTYLSNDGHKADIEPARMILGDKKGGVIRLWPDEEVTTGLGIAEGIETALSLAHAFTPVWACIDAGNLAAFPVLDGIECLTIAADNDDAGIRAAEECATRWSAAGREVRIVLPPTAGADLNDVALETDA